MLGHRGCRLGISYPGNLRDAGARDLRGRIAAAKEVATAPVPEIMIPLIATRKELDITRAQVDAVAAEVFAETGTKIEYIGRHDDRAAARRLRADEIAEVADFFSFGTNDLTQTVFGLSRDDAGKFLPPMSSGHPAEGSIHLDRRRGRRRDGAHGGGEGRKTKNDLKLGICGEHGGDPASITFCHEVGLDYVSCSPYRVPIARLAAAQAALGVKADRTRRRGRASSPSRCPCCCLRLGGAIVCPATQSISSPGIGGTRRAAARYFFRSSGREFPARRFSSPRRFPRRQPSARPRRKSID